MINPIPPFLKTSKRIIHHHHHPKANTLSFRLPLPQRPATPLSPCCVDDTITEGTKGGEEEANMITPICFSNPYRSSQQAPQNLTTSLYQAQLCNTPILITLTWFKTLFSHSVTIQAPELFSTTISLNPSKFSLLRTRPGSKSITLTHQDHRKIKLMWDFTQVVFARDSADPDSSSYYIAITFNGKVEFFLGDGKGLSMLTRATGKSAIGRMAEPTRLSKREHLFGRRIYRTRARFIGIKHDLELECNEGVLTVRVDGEVSLVVKRLAWKFRGNVKILMGGIWVDFCWDVFNWVSGERGRYNNSYGVFVFQVGDGGVCPEMVGPEKSFMRKCLSASNTRVMLPPSQSFSSVLQWTEESSDCGRSSCSSSIRSSGSGGIGFSLVLYAWIRE